MNKLTRTIIIASFFIISGSLSVNYYETLKNDENNKIAMEKENYKNYQNPYYVNSEILKGNNPESILLFLTNKSNYYAAQKELDNENYEKSISYLEKMNLSSFNVLKYDLMGDIYFYKGNMKEARNNYEKATSAISKENAYLKESIFSKFQKTYQ